MNLTLFPVMAALLLSAVIGASAAANVPPEIEDEQVLGINKQPWHATLMPYADLTEALKANWYKSSYARSLNGQWKFHWSPRPEQRPVDFYKTDFDDSAWKTIPVPSNWQMQGYDTPIYRNNGYTFQRDWPRVMSEPPRDYTAYTDRDPVGSYRREFDVPASWDGRRIFLDFDGVDSSFFLWINGHKVGYSVNSRNVAEFDITPYLKGGRNSLAAEVYRYCAGSYLEDQDMWRLSGIFRNVTLWSAPNVHIRDFRIVTDLDSQYRDARLKVTAKVHNFGGEAAAARTLTVSLFDTTGKAMPGVHATAAVPALAPGEEQEVSVEIPVSNPAKWTAETPNLYTAVLNLGDPATTELLSQRVGFRKVEIKGRIFLLNGVPIKLKGVNRHENEPNTGHYVTEQDMLQDIVRLKEANCNHVRTSHYTNDPRWYELCDQYGLYLVAEANIECHGLYNVLDREPRYEKAFLDRNAANVENLKNHPSVIIWSMGNECGGGSNMRAAEKMVRGLDSTRPTHYEAFGIGDNNPASLDSQMYTTVGDVERNALNDKLTKPYYMCEYAHAMFNSMGNLGEYNDVFDKYPSILGGAIWEWEDQGLWNRRDPKRQYLAYGGGFGDVPNDHYFIHKGVVFSDRTPKPHFPEVKRVYQWIGFAPADLAQGRIKIKNKYAFIDLGGFKGSWTLLEDGISIQHGALPHLTLGPQQETELTLSIKPYHAKPGAKYYLNVSMALAADASWQKAGYVVAGDQMEMPGAVNAPMLDAARMKPVTVADVNGTIAVTGDGFTVAFDRATGQIARLARGGVNVILPGGGPKLQLWRAPHHMDDEWASGKWEQMGLKDLKVHMMRIDSHQVSPAHVRVDATVQYTGRSGFVVTHAVSYNVFGDGSVVVDNAVTPQGPRIELARMGVQMLLDKRLARLDYLARGPMENYSDRKRGSDIGRYASTVAEQMTPYSKPMECGNHEDTRWLALTGSGLPTFLARAEDAPLQFSALPYSDEQMDKPAYTVDLPPSNATVLCLSARTLGAGQAGNGPLPQYRNPSDAMAFSYTLQLLPTAMQDLAVTARQSAPTDRIRLVLAARDTQGFIMLTGGGSVGYAKNGAAWQPYTAPFTFAEGGTLAVRSSSGGQSIETEIPFDAFVDRTRWKVTASSFEPGEGDPMHVIDGDPGTIWHSQYTPERLKPPHSITVDMAEPLDIQAVKVTPRTDAFINGRAKEYELYVSEDGTFSDPVLKGSLPNDGATQTLQLPSPRKARYIKFVVLHDQPGFDFGSLAEITVVPTATR